MRRTLLSLIPAVARRRRHGRGRHGPAPGRAAARQRDDDLRQRPRLGPRRRHEPVRGARVRQRGPRLRGDPGPLLPRHHAGRRRRSRACACSCRSSGLRSRSRRRCRSASATSSARPRSCRPARTSSARRSSCLSTAFRRRSPGRSSCSRARARSSSERSPPGEAYRGQLVVSVTGRRLTVVNDVGLEQYLAGRRAEGDAGRVASRGAQCAGGGGALVRARAPDHRQGLRPLR